MKPPMKSRLTLSPLGKLLLLPALAFTVAIPSANAVLLSYWNFNNSTTYDGTTLGSFKATADTNFGEQYDTTTNPNKILYSNTGNSTVFNSSSIYLDLSQLGGTNQNGGVASQFSWGIFTNTNTNRVSGDTTASGSLFANGTGFNGKFITFNLSSLGYSNLSVSYAERTNNVSTVVQSWSYSTDGTSFTALTTFGNTAGSFVAQSIVLPSSLDNKGTFYLRLTYDNTGAASSAIDNFQFTGTAIPEPSTVALLTGGAALLLVGVCRFRRKGA